MRERIRPTKSGLFAIELLIAVGVFTLCAAICVGIFVKAENMSRDSSALSAAVNEARNVAECYKAAGGDLEQAAALCGGVLEAGALTKQAETVRLRLTATKQEGYSLGELTAFDGETALFHWTVAALPEAAA